MGWEVGGCIIWPLQDIVCFEAVVHESTIFSVPPPTCIAHTVAILLQYDCAIYASPPTPPPFVCHTHTILMIPISCKGQCIIVFTSPKSNSEGSSRSADTAGGIASDPPVWSADTGGGAASPPAVSSLAEGSSSKERGGALSLSPREERGKWGVPSVGRARGEPSGDCWRDPARSLLGERRSPVTSASMSGMLGRGVGRGEVAGRPVGKLPKEDEVAIREGWPKRLVAVTGGKAAAAAAEKGEEEEEASKGVVVEVVMVSGGGHAWRVLAGVPVPPAVRSGSVVKRGEGGTEAWLAAEEAERVLFAPAARHAKEAAAVEAAAAADFRTCTEQKGTS